MKDIRERGEGKKEGEGEEMWVTYGLCYITHRRYDAKSFKKKSEVNGVTRNSKKTIKRLQIQSPLSLTVYQKKSFKRIFVLSDNPKCLVT